MRIIDASLSEIMEEKFIDYAREVIGERALPDVRDGLKPVQRRILWSMYEAKFLPEGRFRKSARVVGDVMAQYHPHGDSSIYGAMVKQIQPFTRRLPMIAGQGNFGTIDDNPAAMRYTEVKLSFASKFILDGIKKEIVPFVNNYDDEKQEPSILPARIPHLLINGTSGIAVGMTSEILPHNPLETIDAALLLLTKPQASIGDLMKKIPGPDFPTGALISNEDLTPLYETGYGAITSRGEVVFEEAVRTRNIVIKSLPYQCSMDTLLRKIAQLVERDYPDAIKDIRDESSEDIGVRVVIEVSKNLDAPEFVEALYKRTQLEKRFTSNMVALVDGKPRVLNLKQILQEFLHFRHDTLVASFKDQKDILEKKLHVLYALEIAADNIEKVISIIRKSDSTADAKRSLMKTFTLSAIQAQAVLDLRLAKLTKLEIKDLQKEIKTLEGELESVNEYLASKDKRTEYIQKELRQIKKEFAHETRRTKIIDFNSEQHEPEIKDDKLVLQAIDHKITKRKENFTGRKGVILKTDLSKVILIFLEDGQCLRHTVGYLPDKLESNVLALVEEDSLKSDEFFLVCYSNGFVKKSYVKDIGGEKSPFDYCKLREDIFVVDVKFMTKRDTDLILVSEEGFAIRFELDEINPTGLIGIGVTCLKIDDGSLAAAYFPRELKKEQEDLEDVLKQKRGGKGKHIYKEQLSYFDR